MGTRSGIVYTGDGIVTYDKEGLTLYLYREMDDGAVHLELLNGTSNSLINIVIPENMVPDLTALLMPLNKE